LRSLQTLSDTASTSRVLNLSRVHMVHRQEPQFLAQPFFSDPGLNRAIFIKHRLRRDETYLIPNAPAVATKIIFPFDTTMLRSGGRSIFIGQTGFRATMEEVLGTGTPEIARDFEIMNHLATLPSLDPFLLKEYLARVKHFPADCYFDISPADSARMFAFVSKEVGALIALAFGAEAGGADSPAVTRLVEAMMARDAGERLDPLRATLGLTGKAFDEGIFSWKGFLFYKWQFSDTAQQLSRVISDIDLMRFDDKPSAADLEVITAQRVRLRKSMRSAARECTAILSLYNDAFRDLIDKGKAAAFRKFLLEAPRLFIDLGYSMGTISHITSFWRHRFPDDATTSIESSEFTTILADFQASMKPDSITEKAW
jgi:hypothetical protein